MDPRNPWNRRAKMYRWNGGLRAHRPLMNGSELRITWSNRLLESPTWITYSNLLLESTTRITYSNHLVGRSSPNGVLVWRPPTCGDELQYRTSTWAAKQLAEKVSARSLDLDLSAESFRWDLPLKLLDETTETRNLALAILHSQPYTLNFAPKQAPVKVNAVNLEADY